MKRKREKSTVPLHSFKEDEGACSQEVENGTGGANGKVSEGRESGRLGQERGCTEKYRVETLNWSCLLTSWEVTKENRNVIQGGVSWL